jgi:hypothetical protein
MILDGFPQPIHMPATLHGVVFNILGGAREPGRAFDPDSIQCRNQSATAGIDRLAAQQKADAMHLGYVRPFSFQIGARPETKVSSIRHGVTEITLSDGRLVRATLHIKSVKADSRKPGAIDVSYNVITEVMATPDVPICNVHETIQ